MSKKSNINIQIALGEDKVPNQIFWNAPDGGVPTDQETKAMLLGMWDGQAKEALRIDLWTDKMMMDEMIAFIGQTIGGMADTYLRATGDQELSDEMKKYAYDFKKRAEANLEKKQSQG